MEYRILGKTGLKVSRLGFGGIPIQRIDVPGTRKLMEAMAAAGVNYIDTARGYTVSEEYLGEALEGLRDKFVLATKSMARSKEAMAKDVEISLSNLRTDYIDLYQLHNLPETDVDKVLAPDGALAALFEAREAGKIGHIGVTTHSIETFRRVLEFDWVETIMFPYNIVETQADELIRACHEKNIGFIDMKPLAGGAIDDATLALRFLFANNNIDLVIPGMAELKEFEQNLAASENTAPISEDELAAMDKLRNELGTQFCRRCNYCAPCTAGINISMMFLLEGYYKRYNLVDWASSRYKALDIDASACIDCGVCETRCPYNLPIREMLKSVVATFAE